MVNLTPPELKVAAGSEPVEMQANVRNGGSTVDQYSIEIENLDPSWYTIGVQSVSLFPGDSAPIPIKLHPPKGSNTRAGHYTFVVRARSHADPTLVGVTKGVLQVGSFSNFQVELAPKRVTGYRGKFRLSLQNGGNSEVQLGLAGRDPESELGYSFRPGEPTVQPGSKLVVPMTVRGGGLRIVGQPKKHQFSVIVQPTDGTEKDAREVQGEFIQKPPFKSLRKPGLLALLFLLLLLIATPARASLCYLPGILGTYGCQFDSAVKSMFRPAAQEISVQECTSGPGFTEVRENYPDQIGKCAEPEWYDANGNAHQKTTKGRLMYVQKGSTPQIYFFAGDTIFTFEECNVGTFVDCKIVEVLRPQDTR